MIYMDVYARIRLLPISKKLVSGVKKKFISEDKKNIFPAMFLFCLFFFDASLTFFKIGQKFFLFRRPR